MELTIKVPFVDKVVDHVKRNKTAYLVGSLVVLTNGLTFLVMRQMGGKVITMSPVFNNKPIFNNDNSSLVNFGGHTTKLVKRASDGKVWESVTEAAEANGAPLSLMSRHLNGHKPDVHGKVFKIVGVGTTGTSSRYPFS